MPNNKLQNSSAVLESPALTSPNTSSSKSDFIDEKELLKRLPVSRRTLFSWRTKGKIPSVRLSVIGHITETELKKKLGDNAINNGFINRFLPVCAKRARLLPDGGNLTEEDFENLAGKLARAIDAARKISRLIRSDEARNLWHEVYPKLTGDRAGNYGAVTSRAEAHVLRLSIIYALFDGSSQIELCHLKAALECWRYAQDSALYIWGDFTQSGIAEKIRIALAGTEENGLTRSQLNGALGGRITAEEFSPELGKMISSGEVIEFTKPTAGRRATIYKLRA